MGKLKSEYEAACAMYEKRLSGHIKLNLKELPEAFLPQNPSPADIKKALDTEGNTMIAFSQKSGGQNVALCVEGKPLSSEAFAKILCQSNGGHVNFFIGSSHGLSENVKKFADLKLSLSQMTLPHALARVFLLEQIYRGVMINAGSKYHK